MYDDRTAAILKTVSTTLTHGQVYICRTDIYRSLLDRPLFCGRGKKKQTKNVLPLLHPASSITSTRRPTTRTTTWSRPPRAARERRACTSAASLLFLPRPAGARRQPSSTTSCLWRQPLEYPRRQRLSRQDPGWLRTASPVGITIPYSNTCRILSYSLPDRPLRVR